MPISSSSRNHFSKPAARNQSPLGVGQSGINPTSHRNIVNQDIAQRLAVGKRLNRRNPPYRLELIANSAEVFDQYLHSLGVSQSEYCRGFGLSPRLFAAWFANRNTSSAEGHKRRGPVKILSEILAADVDLPDEVSEALRDVVEYVDRYLRKR